MLLKDCLASRNNRHTHVCVCVCRGARPFLARFISFRFLSFFLVTCLCDCVGGFGQSSSNRWKTLSTCTFFFILLKTYYQTVNNVHPTYLWWSRLERLLTHLQRSVKYKINIYPIPEECLSCLTQIWHPINTRKIFIFWILFIYWMELNFFGW